MFYLDINKVQKKRLLVSLFKSVAKGLGKFALNFADTAIKSPGNSSTTNSKVLSGKTVQQWDRRLERYRYFK